MDYVTHALMGTIGAAPLFMGNHPVAGCCFALGNLIPDLDSLSRIFGKRAFMKAHQTYTHALPVIAGVTLISWPIFGLFGIDDPYASLALGLGLLCHTFTDLSNTYGITLFQPFSARRYCMEWVFFIDSFVLIASLVAMGLIVLQFNTEHRIGWRLPLIYAGFLAAYWGIKVLLRARSWKAGPNGMIALLPSAMWPGIFFGCARKGAIVELFKANGWTRTVTDVERIEVLDDHYSKALESVPEYRIMRSLSPAYHVVEAIDDAGRTRLRCRDLRTRNFKTRFGGLDIVLDADGKAREVTFHA